MKSKQAALVGTESEQHVATTLVLIDTSLSIL
jgi:hypothetical protein